MGQKVTQSLFQSESNAMQNAIQQILLNQVNTIVTGIVTAVNKDGTYDVQPSLKYLNLNDNPTTPPIIPNVPASVIRFGAAGVKGSYTKDDAVLLGIVQRDISILKKAWGKLTKPGSYRKFSLPDAIILNGLSNVAPTTFVELKDGEINITTTTVNINASKININGELVINDLPYVDHQHTAGDYLDSTAKPVTGVSGGLS